MPSSFWVASTKPEAALNRSKAGSLAKGEGGLWRRVIAGQKPTCIAGRALNAVLETLGFGQRLELLERVVLDLADALSGDAERTPDFLQRAGLRPG